MEGWDYFLAPGNSMERMVSLWPHRNPRYRRCGCRPGLRRSMTSVSFWVTVSGLPTMMLLDAREAGRRTGPTPQAASHRPRCRWGRWALISTEALDWYPGGSFMLHRPALAVLDGPHETPGRARWPSRRCRRRSSGAGIRSARGPAVQPSSSGRCRCRPALSHSVVSTRAPRFM